MKRIFFAILLVLFLAGCGGGGGAAGDRSTDVLEGTSWTNDSTYNASVTVTFGSDGEYAELWEGQGTYSGVYSINENTLTIGCNEKCFFQGAGAFELTDDGQLKFVDRSGNSLAFSLSTETP